MFLRLPNEKNKPCAVRISCCGVSHTLLHSESRILHPSMKLSACFSHDLHCSNLHLKRRTSMLTRSNTWFSSQDSSTAPLFKCPCKYVQQILANHANKQTYNQMVKHGGSSDRYETKEREKINFLWETSCGSNEQTPTFQCLRYTVLNVYMTSHT